MKLALAIAGTLLLLRPTLADERPNVLLIVTDDQGYGDMSCHGNPWLKTPNLDRLAAQSVQLEDYHVAPVCTPTRASLMTGRYSTRVGAWAVTQGRQLLNADEATMAEVFANSGYRTGMFGKWHLGDSWPYAPRFRGFQQVVRHLAGGIDEIGNPIGNDYFDDTYYRNGQKERIEGYCTDVFFDECQRMIKKASTKPFFIYLPLNAMHGPHTVPTRYSDPFKAMGHSDDRSKFFGQITHFDERLGGLLSCLSSERIEDDTIVIFMGDNGTAQGTNGKDFNDGFNAGMRGKKGTVYEGGHRVACFVRWPKKLKADRRIERLTSCRDWLPTLVDWCGLDTPREITFDGKNIDPLLRDRVKKWPERTFIVERQGDQPKLAIGASSGRRHPQYAVLTEQWRLVNGQLFDATADPCQKKNVASSYPEIVTALNDRYKNYFSDVFEEGHQYTRFHIGASEENPTRLTVRDWHPTNGNVIWKQEQLADDSLAINGFWAVDVLRAGHYQVRLSRFPDDALAAMGARKSRLQIGEKEKVKNLNPSDRFVTFDIELPEGDALVQTWMTPAQGNAERGAYFVHFQYLEQ